MTDLSDEEKIAQAKQIYAEVMELARRFQRHGLRVADLLWVAATICEMFLIASRDEVLAEPATQERIIKSIAVRLAAMERTSVTIALTNRLLIDETINDLVGGGADFEETESPFKA